MQKNNKLNIAIGIVTAPRLKDSAKRVLLGLKNIDMRPGKIHVFAEPNAPVPSLDFITVHQNETTKGCFKNFYDAHIWLLDNTKTDYILVLPDDLKYKQTLLKHVQNHLQNVDAKTMGYIALHTPMGMRQHFERKQKDAQIINLEQRFGTGGWGGCYLMHRDNAQLIFNHEFMQNHYNNYKANQQFDEAIKETCHLLGLKQYNICPSLFDTTLTPSTIGHPNRDLDKGLNFGAVV